MNEKKPVNSYRTGATQPQKSHSGLIAVLLAIIILLGGLVSALGVMNIHFFRMLQKEPEKPDSVRFSQDTDIGENPAVSDDACEPLAFGLTGFPLTARDRLLFHLPAGIYITAVAPDTPAYRQGVLPGDVLLQVAGMDTGDLDAFSAAYACTKDSSQVKVLLLRDGRKTELTLTIEE